MKDTTCLLLIIVVVALYLYTNTRVIEGVTYDHENRDCSNVTCEQVDQNTWNDIINQESQNKKGQDCYMGGDNIGHLTSKVNFGDNCPCQISDDDDYCDNTHTCTKVIPDDTAPEASGVILDEGNTLFTPGNFRYACRSKVGHLEDGMKDGMKDLGHGLKSIGHDISNLL